MKTILVLLSHYVPGYKAGGPLRSVANLVEQLGDEFRFKVATLDHDFGDSEPYAGITPGVWQRVGKASVVYLPLASMRGGRWRHFVRSIDHDAVYLNSLFDPAVVHHLVMRRMGLIPARPTVLAPRGEISCGALSIKPLKKKLFLALARRLDLYRGIHWQGTCEEEVSEIGSLFGHRGRRGSPVVALAPNLVSVPAVPAGRSMPEKEAGAARVVFVSRIAAKKNLAFAISALAGVTGRVEFDIYGPTEDAGYWQTCQALISRLPDNVRATYCGVLKPDDVTTTFSRYHLFLFPTLGENHGHVIAEALMSGCPVLLSDQTPWRGLAGAGVGWDLPLGSPEAFVEAAQTCVDMNSNDWGAMSERARALGLGRAQDPDKIEASRRMFQSALECGLP